jgi:hypothetical protein
LWWWGGGGGGRGAGGGKSTGKNIYNLRLVGNFNRRVDSESSSSPPRRPLARALTSTANLQLELKRLTSAARVPVYSGGAYSTTPHTHTHTARNPPAHCPSSAHTTSCGHALWRAARGHTTGKMWSLLLLPLSVTQSPSSGTRAGGWCHAATTRPSPRRRREAALRTCKLSRRRANVTHSCVVSRSVVQQWALAASRGLLAVCVCVCADLGSHQLVSFHVGRAAAPWTR